MATYENADYVRTRAAAVLLEMMEETDYREIRVSELVRRAQVSRSSFYRNFTDKDDVLRQHLRYLTAQWRESLEEGSEQDLSGSLIRHFYAHRDLCLLLHSSGLFWMVYDHIKEACGVNADTPSWPTARQHGRELFSAGRRSGPPGGWRSRRKKSKNCQPSLRLKGNQPNKKSTDRPL